MRTVRVWGDQLNRELVHLRGSDPSDTRGLLVLSDHKLSVSDVGTTRRRTC